MTDLGLNKESGGVFFRKHNNGADGKLHSLQKCNLVLSAPTS